MPDFTGSAPPSSLEPIDVAVLRDGLPYAPRYGDIYHSHAGGLGQAHHVFLGGNGLPQRWALHEQFVVVETGFGLGLNFLATWATWHADPQRPRRLHFVSIEKHPFSADALGQAHAASGLHDDAALRSLCETLRAQWPVPTPGLHRLVFDAGAVTLTLAFGDVSRMLPGLVLGADAFYLDGFAPARNPDMWSSEVLRGLARLARDDATLATWTAAGFVRRGLAEAGFAVERAPGFGDKRDMTVARFAPRWQVRRYVPPAAAAWRERRALVIGAGLAGCPIAAQLARRGWHVTVFDRQAHAAAETSAHHAAMLHPHLSPDDNLLARASRAGFWQTLARWRELAASGHARRRGVLICTPREASGDAPASGMLERALDAADAQAKRALCATLDFPGDYVRWLEPREAEVRSGVPCPYGGLWFAQGDWVAPPDWCAAELSQGGAAIAFRGSVEIAALRRTGRGAVEAGWQVLDAGGTVLAEAPLLVLANALDAPRLLSTLHPGMLAALPLRPVRGQLSRVPETALTHMPHAVICGDGYALPPLNGLVQVGASYADNDADSTLREADHLDNLQRLQRLTGASLREAPQTLAAYLDGFAALRCVAPDRMPLIGAVPDLTAIDALANVNSSKLAGAHLHELPRFSGLYLASGYASRGVTWAVLGADCLASAVEGEPQPLERDLLAAIDPARFILRGLRRGQRVC